MSFNDSQQEPELVAFSTWNSPHIEWLVDREDQIDKFKDVLSRISRKRPISKTLFEWWGGPGIGKSQLIKLLIKECKDFSRKNCSWALIRFTPDNTAQYMRDPVTLIEEIASALTEDLTFDIFSLKREVQTYRESPHPAELIKSYYTLSRKERLYANLEWMERLKRVVVEFETLIRRLSQTGEGDFIRPVVIFFDETEKAAVRLVDWIEDWLIGLLQQLDHCVIIWTARRSWRLKWRDPALRLAFDSEPLGVFPQDHAKAQIQCRSSNASLVDQLFSNIYSVTNGHPSATAVATLQINSFDWKQGITPETVADFQSALLKKIYDQFIRNYVFEDFAWDERTALELLAMVRMFDTVMMREILQTAGGEEFKGWKNEDFGELLRRLKRSRLLSWKNGYTLDSDLRHLIKEYFLCCEQETFRVVNQAGLKEYRARLGRSVDNWNLFIVEELYHHASLIRLGETEIPLQQILQNRLEQYPYRITDDLALRQALERLQGEIEHDLELNLLTNGISNSVLVERVQTFLKQEY